MYTLTLKVHNNRVFIVPEESDNIPMHIDEPVIIYFGFSPEWKNAAVVIGFYNADGECPPQVLMEDSYCMVPPEALNGYWFRLGVLGKRNDTVLRTNKLTIVKNGG